jgi:site-specific recombinase XerD
MIKPKLLDQVRDAIRVKHYSLRTEKTYIHWIKRYIFFHDKRHPAEMGEDEIRRFLTHLAVNRDVAAATQNQALSAILFLYKDVLRNWTGLTVSSAPRNPHACPSCSPARKSGRFLVSLREHVGSWLASSMGPGDA